MHLPKPKVNNTHSVAHQLKLWPYIIEDKTPQWCCARCGCDIYDTVECVAYGKLYSWHYWIWWEPYDRLPEYYTEGYID